MDKIIILWIDNVLNKVLLKFVEEFIMKKSNINENDIKKNDIISVIDNSLNQMHVLKDFIIESKWLNENNKITYIFLKLYSDDSSDNPSTERTKEDIKVIKENKIIKKYLNNEDIYLKFYKDIIN